MSLLVLLIPIALLLAFYRGFLGGEEPATVDPAPAIEQARSRERVPGQRAGRARPDWRTVTARSQTRGGRRDAAASVTSPRRGGACSWCRATCRRTGCCPPS